MQPNYARLRPQPRSSAAPNPAHARLFGVLAIAIGLGSWWYNWHLLVNEGSFYIKLTILGPAGLLGGLLMLMRPQWTGAIRKDSTKEHKTALAVLIGLIAVLSGITFYFMSHYRR